MRLIPIAIAAFAALPAMAQDVRQGEVTFQYHCATCHGANAQGDGPMAPVLMVQPPDLTGLAARNDGVFPVARVTYRIDGRDPLVSHGSAMPVYGPLLDRERTAMVRAETGQTLMTAQPVVDLIAWLTSVQNPPLAPDGVD